MFNYNELKECSDNKVFFLVNRDGNRIPARNLLEDGHYYIGEDFINNIPIKILKQNVGGYFSIIDVDPYKNKMYLQIKQHFDKVKDSLIAEKVPLNSEFLYEELSPSQKILSTILNKKWEDITLSDLKHFWIVKINEYALKIREYIDSEISLADNENYKKELLIIKDELDLYNDEKYLESFQTKEELIKFWPRVLYPSPGFVENET
jgi:hypothetical protein